MMATSVPGMALPQLVDSWCSSVSGGQTASRTATLGQLVRGDDRLEPEIAAHALQQRHRHHGGSGHRQPHGAQVVVVIRSRWMIYRVRSTSNMTIGTTVAR